MGLNCSHGAYDGSYSGFKRFRDAVGVVVIREVMPPWHIGGCELFLSHSDCDGELSPEECILVAAFLRWAASHMPLSSDPFAVGPSTALQFAEGCERAAAAGEPLEFG